MKTCCLTKRHPERVKRMEQNKLYIKNIRTDIRTERIDCGETIDCACFSSIRSARLARLTDCAFTFNDNESILSITYHGTYVIVKLYKYNFL
jgi:hypothetical protein